MLSLLDSHCSLIASRGRGTGSVGLDYWSGSRWDTHGFTMPRALVGRERVEEGVGVKGLEGEKVSATS